MDSLSARALRALCRRQTWIYFLRVCSVCAVLQTNMGLPSVPVLCVRCVVDEQGFTFSACALRALCCRQTWIHFLRVCFACAVLQTNMGSAELRAEFGSKKHELSVSTQQMCILLLFNAADRLSYSEVRVVAMAAAAAAAATAAAEAVVAVAKHAPVAC